MENLDALYQEACTADDAYQRELQAAFPKLKHWGDVRYRPEGHGAPGSALRLASDRKRVADAALHLAMLSDVQD